MACQTVGSLILRLFFHCFCDFCPLLTVEMHSTYTYASLLVAVSAAFSAAATPLVSRDTVNSGDGT